MKPIFETQKVTAITSAELERRTKRVYLAPPEDGRLMILGAGNRGWQPDCFNKLKDERFLYFTAFMGSGKALVLKYFAAYDLIRSGGFQKQVIVVPLTSLNEGFLDDRIQLLGREWEWAVGVNNLCEKKTTQVIAKLITALLEPIDAYRSNLTKGLLNGPIIVTSDIALALAWRRMTPAQRRSEDVV